jgi:hypothetical protein
LKLSSEKELPPKFKNGTTPLSTAAGHGYMDMEEFLRRHGGHK